MGASPKEITGAWVIHHGRKAALDANGAAEFPAIDEASKAATLLTKLGQHEQVSVPIHEVKAIAVASGLNPRHELSGLLDVLQKKRLIDRSTNEIAVLGVTTRGSLARAAEIFEEAEPSAYELASITLAELVSEAPLRRSEVIGRIADRHKLTNNEGRDFLDRAESIGFVDREGDGNERILFNGNLFRRDFVIKVQRVLESLSNIEQRAVREVAELLSARGCLLATEVESMCGKELFTKLVAAGVYDLNEVSNEVGLHLYVTSPAAFHKFVDPMVDDCFDMAKSLVSALTYGMRTRSASEGRINALSLLLGKLIRGGEVGPATAIGNDYRVLESNRVVKLRPDRRPGLFFMRLLKVEVGQLALEVLTKGNADEGSLIELPGAPMSGYVGPEESRVSLRRRQGSLSKKATMNILESVRSGRRL